MSSMGGINECLPENFLRFTIGSRLLFNLLQVNRFWSLEFQSIRVHNHHKLWTFLFVDFSLSSTSSLTMHQMPLSHHTNLLFLTILLCLTTPLISPWVATIIGMLNIFFTLPLLAIHMKIAWLFSPSFHFWPNFPAIL